MADSFIGRTDLPRGIRNNNPGNIEIGDEWQGKTGEDPPFIIFQDITWGLRALATDIVNKINEGYNTITALITRYAPPSENDTQSYINQVSSTSGIGPNDVLGLDTDTISSLMRGIIIQENGAAFAPLVTDQDIQTGIGMMNNQLLSIIQAAGIAVQSAVSNVPGGSSTAIIVLAMGLGLYYFFRKK
jgi:hypothetical protein